MTGKEQKVPLFTIGFKMGEEGSLVMDTFHMYKDFMKLPLGMQHELINEAMEELGESPGYTGRDKFTSLN